MQGFNQRPHEYEMEDYEEYEEEASEPDEEELEAPKSTKDEQDFLKLREQLKARFRQKLKKQSAGALGRLSQTQDKRTVTNDRCVISALCFLGWHHVILLCCKTIAKNKAQTLKDMRDYSFLLSDDADLPTAKEQPKPRSASLAMSDMRNSLVSVVSCFPFLTTVGVCIEVINFLCRYNPNRYVEMDEDDSDMEVGFDVIQKEERRSSKIAKKEDEEQLRLIEEEEGRERRMRTKKKLKQS
ncbi:hypothetical protein B296_00021002 [Ensete ventricosum]|uniref:Uncharacterized protein n=1 Tax=Ensete ventricosum TaxID=4639 RepID=A0A427AU42_ENSVE|nr:hypothetical protein B296_00021002 [Ensete ventricosum]